MAEQNPLDEYAAEVSAALKRDTVQVKNTNVELVEGGQVSLTNSAAQKVNTQALYMENAAAGIVYTQTLEAEKSAIGAVIVGQLNAGAVESKVLVARNVTAGQVNTGLLLALRVQGNVQTQWTPLTAILAGSTFAATLLLVTQLTRRLRGIASRRE